MPEFLFCALMITILAMLGHKLVRFNTNLVDNETPKGNQYLFYYIFTLVNI